MSLWHIAWNYLWNRRLTTSLTILSVALAVGLISALLTMRNETQARFIEEQQAYDVVVGPPGSPIQLTLNAVYYLDRPVGFFAYEKYERLIAEESPLFTIEHAFPIALGDTYQKFRIVGTLPTMFDYGWENDVTREIRRPFQLADGEFFDAPMEAVVGYYAAQKTGLKVGHRFKSIHGTIEFDSDIAEYNHSEDEHSYTVVGVLKPSGTSNDRAIFVDLQSIWDLHEDGNEDEGIGISAILVDLYSSAERFSFIDHVSKEYGATAAIPVIQIKNLYDQVLGPAVVIMMAVGYVVVVISALSILIGLYLSIIQRKRDLAIMRALGASAVDIFGAVMIEAFMVTMLGIAAGWVLGKTVAVGLGLYMTASYGFSITGLSTSKEEVGFFAIVAFVGLFAGIVPAWQAYRSDVARDLSAP